MLAVLNVSVSAPGSYPCSRFSFLFLAHFSVQTWLLTVLLQRRAGRCTFRGCHAHVHTHGGVKHCAVCPVCKGCCNMHNSSTFEPYKQRICRVPESQASDKSTSLSAVPRPVTCMVVCMSSSHFLLLLPFHASASVRVGVSLSIRAVWGLVD